MKPPSGRTFLVTATSLVGLSFYGWYIYLHLSKVGTDTPGAITTLGVVTVVLALATMGYTAYSDKSSSSKSKIVAYTISELLLLPFFVMMLIMLVRAAIFIFS